MRNASILSNLAQLADNLSGALSIITNSDSVSAVLEVGAVANTLSTETLIREAKANTEKLSLYQTQASPETFAKLKNLTQSAANISPYFGLAVNPEEFLSEEEIRRAYTTNITLTSKIKLGDILKERRQLTSLAGSRTDSLINEIKTVSRVNTFDLVLINSSPFTGSAALKNILGAKWIVLKGINTINCLSAYEALVTNPDYELALENWGFEDGFAIFCRTGAPGLTHKTKAVIPSRAKRVLLVRTDAIGDNVLGTGLLPAIREHFAGAEIVVACQEFARDAYVNSPYVDRIISFKRNEIENNSSALDALIKQLKDFNPDVAINCLWSPEVLTHAITLGACAKISIGHYGNLSNIAEANRVQLSQYYSVLVESQGEFEIETKHNEDLLKGMGCKTPLMAPSIEISPELKNYAERVFHENGLNPDKTIAFFVSANPTINARNYDRFRDVFKLIQAKGDFEVLALGAGRDYVLAAEATNIFGLKTVNLCGLTTISQAAALISLARASLGVDTSLSHLACAVGTPNTVILGGGHYGRFFPYSHLTTVASLPLNCFGCNWSCRYESAHCIKELSPKSVVLAFENSLASQQQPSIVNQSRSDYRTALNKPGWGSQLVPTHRSLRIIETENILPTPLKSRPELTPLGLLY
jgi:ADP-heptose:LPS heptosyltransferase